jgi:hypothetical protein
MAPLREITERDVRALVDEGTFERGSEYAREGAIFDARRVGEALRARCEGTSQESYPVEVRATSEGVRADCTCPVGGHGPCKHAVALLLTWIARPADFLVLDDIQSLLGRRSKAELLALIEQMVRQEPDLETLLLAPMPGAKRPRGDEAGLLRDRVALYRRRAGAIFRRASTEWGAVVGVAHDLRAMLAMGDGLLDAGDAADAFALYSAVSGAVIDGAEVYVRQDEDGLLHGVLVACVDGFERCLSVPDVSPEVREAALGALFDILDAEKDDSLQVDDIPETILRRTTPAEREKVAAWIRALRPEVTAWRELPYGRFLLDLEASAMTDEAYLVACRELDLHVERVRRLLQRHRTDEALKAAREAPEWAVHPLAVLLSEHGRDEDAEALVRARMPTPPDTALLQWLFDRVRRRGDMRETTRLIEALFTASPSLDRYLVARSLPRDAEGVEPWTAARARLIEVAERHPHLRVEILLNEGEIDEALRRVKDERTVDVARRLVTPGMKLRVAEEAERTHPAAAIGIYRDHVEGLVALGQRTHYREACKLIKRALGLYASSGMSFVGEEWLRELRLRHKRLRALTEEMKAAGL